MLILTRTLPLSQLLVLDLALSLAIREALVLSNQEGGFGYLMYGSKWREQYWVIKTPFRSRTCCLILLTPTPPLPWWLVLALALFLSVREAIVLSKQEGGFGDLTYRLKGIYPSWGIKPPLCLGNTCPIGLTPPPPLPQWLILALALSLDVREALALYEQEGALKEFTEGLDGRAPYWGNKSSRLFIPKIFDPSNAASVADASTADTAAAVATTGWILYLEDVLFTLDVMVQTYADVSFLMKIIKGDVFVVS